MQHHQSWQSRKKPPPVGGQGAGRTYEDPETGASWFVTESAPSDLPGHAGARCLFFASDMVIRRVWAYPADWRQLSAAELAALSWRK